MGGFKKKKNKQNKVPNVIKQIDDAYNKGALARMLKGKRR